MNSTTNTPVAPPSLDFIRLFDLFTVCERSATLDGAIPLRAAQGCKPLLDGNSAGLHLRLSQDALIEITPNGPILRFTDEAYAAATANYEAQVEQAVAQGLLLRDGDWHRELLAGFVQPTPNGIRLFTGLLAKPSPGLWYLVSSSLNRRPLVRIAEYILADSDAYVPLFLDFEITPATPAQVWLTVELASLTPLTPHAHCRISTLLETPEPGQAFSDFYAERYFEQKSKGTPTGAYRKTVGREATDVAAQATLDLIPAGPATPPEIHTFERFARPEGYTSDHPQRAALEYAIVRTPCPFSARSDGHCLRDVEADPTTEDAAALQAIWSELYGETALGSIAQWLAFAHANQGPALDPYVALQPWMLSRTPTGWSILVEGFDFGPLEGMRGIIASDTYPGLLPVWHFRQPDRVSIPQGTPFLRIIPVARQQLRATWSEAPLVCQNQEA